MRLTKKDNLKQNGLIQAMGDGIKNKIMMKNSILDEQPSGNQDYDKVENTSKLKNTSSTLSYVIRHNGPL